MENFDYKLYTDELKVTVEASLERLCFGKAKIVGHQCQAHSNDFGWHDLIYHLEIVFEDFSSETIETS